ncbi:MAG: aspartate kinase [Tissierellaceae bacterium]|jgi:aspartate kinase|nr:aspartate kinase [Tissierellaceae bacterium]
MKIIVQKFGGTSVSSSESRQIVLKKIIDKVKEGYHVVVVVSAMGRKGSPYSTDSLLDLINKEALNPREIDLLLSCGEIISGVTLSSMIREKGYKAKVLTGRLAGIKTNDNFGNAEVLDVDPSNIINSLKDGNIVIVAGFQGVNSNGEITTLGRGGSDITAVVLGKALHCNQVEIFTDVDGVMTADPNIVENAKVIKTMCYSEVYQLAENGAKVIHPKAVEIAQQSNISLVIKNTFTDSEGTIIEKADTNFYNNRKKQFNDKILTGITFKKGRNQIKVKTDDEKNETERLMNDITINKINIDLINFFIDEKIFTVEDKDLPVMTNILKEGNYKYDIIKNCCKLSAVGYKMHGVPGVMAKIVNALWKNNIKILQSSDSHNTIWCLIYEKDAEAALKILHEEFEMYK